MQKLTKIANWKLTKLITYQKIGKINSDLYLILRITIFIAPRFYERLVSATSTKKYLCKVNNKDNITTHIDVALVFLWLTFSSYLLRGNVLVVRIAV